MVEQRLDPDPNPNPDPQTLLEPHHAVVEQRLDPVHHVVARLEVALVGRSPEVSLHVAVVLPVPRALVPAQRACVHRVVLVRALHVLLQPVHRGSHVVTLCALWLLKRLVAMTTVAMTTVAMTTAAAVVSFVSFHFGNGFPHEF